MSQVTNNLTHPRFQLTEDEEEADIIWSINHIKDYRSVRKTNRYTNINPHSPLISVYSHTRFTHPKLLFTLTHTACLNPLLWMAKSCDFSAHFLWLECHTRTWVLTVNDTPRLSICTSFIPFNQYGHTKCWHRERKRHRFLKRQQDVDILVIKAVFPCMGQNRRANLYTAGLMPGKGHWHCFFVAFWRYLAFSYHISLS